MKELEEERGVLNDLANEILGLLDITNETKDNINSEKSPKSNTADNFLSLTSEEEAAVLAAL